MSLPLFSTLTLSTPIVVKGTYFAFHLYKRNGEGLEEGDFVTVMGRKHKSVFEFTGAKANT